MNAFLIIIILLSTALSPTFTKAEDIVIESRSASARGRALNLASEYHYRVVGASDAYIFISIPPGEIDNGYTEFMFRLFEDANVVRVYRGDDLQRGTLRLNFSNMDLSSRETVAAAELLITRLQDMGARVADIKGSTVIMSLPSEKPDRLMLELQLHSVNENGSVEPAFIDHGDYSHTPPASRCIFYFAN